MPRFQRFRRLLEEVGAAIKRFRAPAVDEGVTHLENPFTIDPKIVEERLADPYGLKGKVPVLPGHDHTISPIGEWGPKDPGWAIREQQLAATRHLEGAGGGMAIGGSAPRREGVRQQFQRPPSVGPDKDSQGQQQQQ